MDATTLIKITDELTAEGWHALDSRATDKMVPIIKALGRHSVRANDSAVLAVRGALSKRRQELMKPVPEPAAPAVDDLGLPVPTTEELADEAAWATDMFFMFELTFPQTAVWTVGDSVHVKSLKPLPHVVRQTAFRAGMTVAAAHGVPDNPPTMRQVVNALIKRMAREGRIKR
ncbi:hypothetical protein AB0H82_19270 [Streptomyces sp. NPDC050732]|uniref:hypothetical protein n=1 Tax=Streptomyces sp. NPDC050732 TaxID=3154632 RepID=UPI003442C08A